MKNLTLTLAIVAILATSITSCSQRYGYISKVKAPKSKQTENLAQQRKTEKKSEVKSDETTFMKNEQVSETLMASEGPMIEPNATIQSQPTVAANSYSKPSGTRALKSISGYANPYKNLSNKNVNLFKKREKLTSSDNLQLGKDMSTVIMLGILGLAAILLAAILDIGFIYTVGGILLLIALIILILILIES